MDQRRSASLDRPATVDRLGFDLYVRRIARTIREASERNQLPLTIGVYGRWGAGKTSLMQMVEANLVPPEQSADRARRREWARRNAPRLWAIQGVWTLLLVVALLLAPAAARLLSGFVGLSRSVTVVGWLAAWFGVLGGLGRAGFEIWRHAAVESDLDPQHTLWFILRAPLGLIAGLVVLAIVVGLGNRWRAEALHPFVATVIYLLAWAAGAMWDLPARNLDLLQRRTQGAQAKQASSPRFQVIWFNAWKYAKEDELWAALLQQVLSQLEVNAYGWARVRIKWQLWRRSIEWKSGVRDIARKLWPTVGKTLLAGAGVVLAAWVVDFAVGSVVGAELGQAAGTAAGLLTSLVSLSSWLRTNVSEPLTDLDLDKYRKKASYKDHLTFLAEFSQELTAVTRIARGAGNPIVLILDDLDRCLPDQAVSVLEAIKLFIGDDAPVAFIIGADREFIERAIEVKYAKLIDKDDPDTQRRDRFMQLGHEYLEKIVQLPFNLPPIERSRIDRFIDEAFSDAPLVTENSHIFTAGLLPNPRQVLRVVGIYRFVVGLADDNGDLYAGTIDPGVLAKLVIVQYRWPDLYAELVERPDLLALIEQSYGEGYDGVRESPAAEAIELVDKHATKRGLRRLLTVPDAPSLAGVNLRPYLFITARAQTQAEPAEKMVAEEVPAKEEEAAAPDIEALRDALEELGDQIDELMARGGDSALIARLLDRRDKIESLVYAGDLADAAVLLEEVEPVAEKALAELEARADEETPSLAIKAQVAKSGQLLFRRALTYYPLEIVIPAAGPGDPVILSITSSPAGEAKWQADPPSDELLESARQFRDGEATPDGVAVLSDLLGDYLRGEIGDIIRRSSEAVIARNAGLRLRLTSQSCAMDDLPWELVRLAPDALPIGLDPRHSFVRGIPVPEPMTGLRQPSPLIMLVAYANPADHPPLSGDTVDGLLKALEPLAQAGALETTILRHATPDRLNEVLLKQTPDVVHLIAHPFSEEPAGSGTDTRGVILEDRDGEGYAISAVDLGRMFRSLHKQASHRVSMLTLDTGRSQSIARQLAAEANIPAVVGWQTPSTDMVRNAFTYAFYSALLRTGQADFAITEGRRAIAAREGAETSEAISPVLYLYVSSDGTVFA